MRVFGKKKINKLLSGLVLMMGGVACLSQAQAAGTASGTAVITNFEVAYNIGGAAQTALQPTAYQFRIGRKIDHTVSTAGAAVVPNTSNQIVAFTLQNTGNSTQQYCLVPVEQDTGNVIADASLGAFEDHATLGTTGSYDVNDISHGAKTASNCASATTDADSTINIAPDGTKTIFVRFSTNLIGVYGDATNIALMAIAMNPSNYVSSVGSNQPSGSSNTDNNIVTADTGTFLEADRDKEFTVFGDADGDGAGSNDAVRNGRHIASATLSVETAKFQVTGGVNPLYDVNPSGSSDLAACQAYSGADSTIAKVIPGACLEITYTLENTSNRIANGLTWTITLPNTLQYASANTVSTIAGSDGDAVTGACSSLDTTNAGNSTPTFTCTITQLNDDPDNNNATTNVHSPKVRAIIRAFVK